MGAKPVDSREGLDREMGAPPKENKRIKSAHDSDDEDGNNGGGNDDDEEDEWEEQQRRKVIPALTGSVCFVLSVNQSLSSTLP